MAQNVLGPAFGFIPRDPSQATSTLAVSAANTWYAFSFIGNGKTLSTVNLFTSGLTGTLATTELRAEIYSTGATGDPNASVSGPHNCDATPASGWNQWSPGYATTDGVMYWVVIKNTHGTPASNYVTFRFGAATTSVMHLVSSSGLWGSYKNHTTDASTWTNEVKQTWGMLLGWSDSTYDGSPFSNLAATGTGNSVYAAREVGVMFAFTGPTINVRALSFFMGANTGTPSAALRARLYSGSSATPTLVATSSGGPVVGQVAAGWFYFPFASSQALAAGTYRVVVGTTGADTSSNRYNTYEYTIKNDAASKALMPFGNAQETYTTDGTTFSNTATALIPFALILDNGSEFTVSGGGGGPLIGTGRLVRN